MNRYRLNRRRRAAVLGLLLVAGGAVANGWEHGAVPLDALVRALSFDSPVIREQAAQSLGYREQEQAVAPLLERLRAPEPDPWVRRAIYEALGRIGAASATTALVGCLDNESLEPLRAACVEALGPVGTPKALRAVLAVLNNEPDAAVRASAVEALGDFESSRAVDALAQILQSSPDDPDLRHRTIRALGRTGAEAAAPLLLDALDRAATDDERLKIVRALAEVGSPVATGPLTALLESTDEPRLRAAAAVALGASRDGDAGDALLNLLDDPVPAVQYMAIAALQRLGVESAAPALAALAKRQGAGLAEQDVAEWVEAPVRTVGVISLQTRALQAAIELDAGAAREALLDAAAPTAVPRTSAKALDVAEAVYRRRRTALHGLGYVEPDPEVVDLLAGRAGVSDPDPRLRAVAVRSLGVLNAPETPETVEPLLADADAEVRMTAARVLGRVEAQQAVPALETALSDSWSLVRREAALALGYIGDAAAAEALRESADSDESQAVREAASYALTLLPADD